MNLPRLPVRVELERRQYPHYDHSSRECFLNLERTHVVVRPLFEQLFRPYGLSGSTFNILMILRSAAQPLAPFAIGERIVVSRATVTGLLDSLESQALIRRDADPTDGRRLLISLTRDGRDLVESLMPEVFALQQDVFAALDAQEKETLIALLGKVQTGAAGIGSKMHNAPASVGAEYSVHAAADEMNGHRDVLRRRRRRQSSEQ